MSLLDRLKNMVGGHEDKARQGIDKAGDMIDKKTGGKHSDKVDRVQDALRDKLRDEGQDPPRP